VDASTIVPFRPDDLRQLSSRGRGRQKGSRKQETGGQGRGKRQEQVGAYEQIGGEVA